MLLALAACNKIETNVQPVENNEGIPFSATISVGNNATTKALAESGSTIVATWAVDETVALIHNGVKDEMTVSAVNEGVATITGTITGSPSDGDAVTVIYPASAADGATGKIKADLLHAQNGLLTGVGSIAANYDARKGTGTLKVNGTTASLNGNMTLTNQFAIFKFTVKNADASATIDVKPLTVTIGTQNYVITPASATSTLFAALPAVSSQTVSFSATGSDSKTYTCSKDGVTFAAGKYYQSTLKMAFAATYTLLSAATTSDVGKVVCAAGHLHDAKTAVPTGCTAVGILGKVTDTGHGLILALQDATAQTWETINGWASTDTYASTTLKVLPNATARGSLTSYTTLGSTAVSNWAVAQKSDYDAIFTNLGSTTGDSDGKTYDDNVNAYITTGVGGTAINGYYWSATERGDLTAWLFNHNFWFSGSKSLSDHVRPVLAF